MSNSQGSHQPNTYLNPRNLESTQSEQQDIFAFLKNEKKSLQPSFFSKNGLSKDIIQVTQAEPDICLEVFYALYHTLLPQIEKQAEVSFKDVWTRFIGGAVFKGSLCPPEKLITERRMKEIKKIWSEAEGENQIFSDLDGVLNSISNLKEKIDNHPGKIHHKKEIIVSLTLAQGFYQDYRKKVKVLVQIILEKEQMNAAYGSETDALEDLLEPKAIMTSDVFDHHWAYRIQRSQAQKLLSLDMHGRNLKKNNINDPSNHRVISLPEKVPDPLVFFKANGNPPIQPEKEYMLYSLYRHFQIPVPETGLIILTDVFEANPEYFYAVQASEAVLGEPSLQAHQNEETVFDHEAYALQVFGAFLTNPSDGSFKNFKYSPKYKTFISIDNDLVFKPELAGKDDKKIVNVKSMLYLFPQMELPIPESIKVLFTSLDPHLTTLSWLQDLSKKNREYQTLYSRLAFQKTRCIYQNLLPQSEASSLAFCLQQKVTVDPEIHSDSFKPQILLSKNLLAQLIEKLQMIEKVLLTNRSVNTQGLFEQISSVLGKYYRKLRFEFSDIEEALEALWGNKKNGVDYSYVSSLLENEESPNLHDNQIGLDENQNPETFFKDLKDILISSSSALDRFIRRHNQRKRKNLLNLQLALRELKLLVQEGLTDSQSIREIADFRYNLSKMIDIDPNLLKEIIFILSNLPSAELKWLLTLEGYFFRPDRAVPKDLLPSSVVVAGAFMKQRTFLLTKSESKYLFDQTGDIRKDASLTGRSRVTCFPQKGPKFYLKQYPEWPGYEFASTSFMRLLGVQHLPYQDLIILNNYPVLITQGVYGDPVIQRWHHEKEFHNLDPVHTGLLIISAMLINPEDGKEDNFILTPDGKYLIPIDNDHCFLPSFSQKEGNIWNAFTVNTALQTKTILFCLDEMYMPIPLEVKQQIQSIDFDELFTKWMNELDKLENKLNNLVDQNHRNKFLEQGTVMRIPFYEQFIKNMHWKAHKIQGILKTKSQPTPFDLLKAVEPFAAKCYQDSFKQGSDLQTRFKAATDQLYVKTAIDGSRVSVLNTRAMMEIINISKEDLQQDNSMLQRLGPVDALEFLNQLIRERRERTKLEQEMLFDDENQEKRFIRLFESPPVETALKAFFASSVEGLALKGSKLIMRSKLAKLFAQTPDKGVKIRFLSLPESPLLTKQEIRILAEECPNIEYLNVSGCPKLEEITTWKEEWPLLVRLEAQDCLELKKFVSYSPVKILKIGTDRPIEIFVEKSTLHIFTVVIDQGDIFELSLKKDSNFEIKYQGKTISHSDFLLLVIRGRVSFEDCRNWKITIGGKLMNLENDFLDSITCFRFEQPTIRVQDIQEMVKLKLINLEKLELSGYQKLEKSKLEYLIQGNWPKLSYLNLSWTRVDDEFLQMLPQRKWPLLETLDVTFTEVTTKGLLNLICQTTWSKLKQIIYDNPSNPGNSNNAKWINCILQKGWLQLEELDMNRSKITANEIEVLVKKCKCPQLKHLDLSQNYEIDDEALAVLSFGDWPLLETLDLSSANVTKKALPHLLLNANWPCFQEITLPENWSPSSKELAYNFIKKDTSLVEKLQFNYFNLSFADIERIIRQHKFPKLKHLNISDTNISLEEFLTLVHGEYPLLEELFLQKTKITLKGIQTLVNQSQWSHLKDLNLSNNEILDEEFFGIALAEWPSLENLNLNQTKLSPKGIEALVTQSKWFQLLKYLNVSNNDIFDEGLSVLALAKWPLLEELHLKNTKITQQGIEVLVKEMTLPNLKKLEISDNAIFDEGLKLLISGNWTFFQHLVYSNTQVTQNGQIFLLENFKWPDLNHLEHSLTESFYNYNENSDEWSPPEIILATAPMSFRTPDDEEPRGMIVTVLDMDWFHSKEIYVSLNDNDVSEKVKILPRDQLNQLECLDISLGTSSKMKSLPSIVLPPCLKTLELSDGWWNDQKDFKRVFSKGCPLLEDLCLRIDNGTAEDFETLVNKLKCTNLKKLELSRQATKNKIFNVLVSMNWSFLENLRIKYLEIDGLETLVNKSNWPNLKTLDLSHGSIENQGLKLLVSANWQRLEFLNLSYTKITGEGLEYSISKSNWPNLKELNICSNLIGDPGFKALASARWQYIEVLYLPQTGITAEGLEILTEKSNWPNLKILDLSLNSIKDEGLERLASAYWPQLEVLVLISLNITNRGIESLVGISKWPNLRYLDLSFNGNAFDEGLGTLASGKWPLLEYLGLQQTRLKSEDIETLVNKSSWLHLKNLDIRRNDCLDEETTRTVISTKWPNVKLGKRIILF